MESKYKTRIALLEMLYNNDWSISVEEIKQRLGKIGHFEVFNLIEGKICYLDDNFNIYQNKSEEFLYVNDSAKKKMLEILIKYENGQNIDELMEEV